MKNTTSKLAYEAPIVEVMAARVERGFISSNEQNVRSGSTEEMSESGSAMWN